MFKTKTNIHCSEVYYQILIDMVCISSIVKIQNINCKFEILLKDANFENSLINLEALDSLGLSIVDNEWVECDKYLNTVDKYTVFRVVRDKLFQEIKIKNEIIENEMLSKYNKIFVS